MYLLIFLAFMAPQKQNQTTTQNSVDSLLTISREYWYNDREKGRYYLNEGLRLAKSINYKKGEADALKGLGFLSQSNIEKLENYINALQIRTEINDSLGIGISLYDIGTVYAELGDTLKTLDYFNRSYALRKQLNDYGGIALCLIGLGHLDEAQKDYNQATKRYHEALQYRRLSGDMNGIAFAHINIAQAALYLNQYDSAFLYATLAQNEFEQANNTRNIPWVNSIKARALFSQHKFDQARDLLYKQEQSTGKLNLSNLLLMSEIFEAKGDYRNALLYHQKWATLKKELDKTTDEFKLSQLASDYEFKIKQKEIEKRELELQRIKNRSNNLQLLSIAVAILIGFIIIIAMRKKTSERLLNICTFAGFLILFEFLIVLIDPSLQTISNNKPILILLGNVLVALIIAPLHHYVDKRFRGALKFTDVPRH